jgi:hypothetical protein
MNTHFLTVVEVLIIVLAVLVVGRNFKCSRGIEYLKCVVLLLGVHLVNNT